MEKALIAHVYRTPSDTTPSYDPTNGGVTAEVNTVLIVGDGVRNGFMDTNKSHLPVLRLVRREQFGDIVAVPEGVDTEGMAGPMFGGNFIYNSDSRFPSDAPIKVFDRYETWDDYNRFAN